MSREFYPIASLKSWERVLCSLLINLLMRGRQVGEQVSPMGISNKLEDKMRNNYHMRNHTPIAIKNHSYKSIITWWALIHFKSLALIQLYWWDRCSNSLEMGSTTLNRNLSIHKTPPKWLINILFAKETQFIRTTERDIHKRIKLTHLRLNKFQTV